MSLSVARVRLSVAERQRVNTRNQRPKHRCFPNLHAPANQQAAPSKVKGQGRGGRGPAGEHTPVGGVRRISVARKQKTNKAHVSLEKATFRNVDSVESFNVISADGRINFTLWFSRQGSFPPDRQIVCAVSPLCLLCCFHDSQRQRENL